MHWLVRGLRTSVGSKLVMAGTGALLFGFVIAHLLGNLQVFLGWEQINAYAQGMKDLGPLLWVARIGLLSVFALHVAMAFRLTRMNRAARPIGYAVQRPIQSTHASRSMLPTGLVVLLFVVYHLMHFTIGVGIRPDFFALEDPKGRHDVYRMMVLGFQQPEIALFYILAMVGLGSHLLHGVASVFQSVGLNAPRWRTLTLWGTRAIVVAIVLGNIAMPLAAWTGLLELPAHHEGGVR